MSAALTPEDVVERSLRPVEAPADTDAPWEIEDRSGASWAMSKIRQAHVSYDLDTADTRTAIDALRAEADRLQETVDRRAKERDSTVAFFSGKLTDWLRRLREQDPDTTSVKLPGGRVRSRAGVRKAIVDAEQIERLAEFAHNVEAPLVKVEPRKKAILDYVKATGEVPPGVTVEQGERTYTVDLDGDS